MTEPASRADFFDAFEEMLRDRWPDGTRTRDLTSPFGTTRVLVSGSPDAPPIVLFPAYQATSAVWGDLASALGGDRQVYAVDPIGDAGRSVAGSRGIETPEDQVEWIDGVLDGLGLDTAELGGHSYGAWIAMNYARQRPARVRRVVLLDPTMVFGPLNRGYVVRALPALMRPTGARRESLIRWESRSRPVDPQWLRLTFLAAEAFPDVPTVRTKVPGGADVMGLDLPVLVVMAGASRVHPTKKVVTRAGKMLRHGRVEVLPDAAHYALPISHASEIADLIRG